MFHKVIATILLHILAVFPLYQKTFDTERLDKETNKVVAPSMIVVNYTMQPDIENSLLSLQRHGVSCHYIIDKDGTIYKGASCLPEVITSIDSEYVKLRTWHAGASYWDTIKNVNSYAIGIIFVCEGAHPKENPNALTIDDPSLPPTTWFDFTSEQIESFIKLTQQLKTIYNINDKNIVGQGEVAINPETQSLGRKIGPGPKFPWKYIASQGIGLYHNLSEDELRRTCNIEPKDLQRLLQKWGYKVEITNEADEQTQQAVQEAQIHHDQEYIDKNCTSSRFYMIMKSLLAQHYTTKSNRSYDEDHA